MDTMAHGSLLWTGVSHFKGPPLVFFGGIIIGRWIVEDELPVNSGGLLMFNPIWSICCFFSETDVSEMKKWINEFYNFFYERSIGSQILLLSGGSYEPSSKTRFLSKPDLFAAPGCAWRGTSARVTLLAVYYAAWRRPWSFSNFCWPFSKSQDSVIFTRFSNVSVFQI